MTQTALIVEGGAMRAIYAAGVLDVFHETGFDPFDVCYGVSAGALNLSSFLARQHGRNHRILTRLAVQPPFIRLGRMIVPGANVMDLDWLWAAMMTHEPLDTGAAFGQQGMGRMWVCCTRMRDGRPVWFRASPENWQSLAMATCALPMFYRSPVHFEGERWLDGAVSDALPVQHAHARGARRIVVIRTRPAEFRKRKTLNHLLVRRARHPDGRLRAMVEGMADRYNRSADFIAQPPADTQVWQVAPSRALLTGRTTRNRQTLQADYLLGRADAHAFLDGAAPALGGLPHVQPALAAG